jgi:hypothetical protein
MAEWIADVPLFNIHVQLWMLLVSGVVLICFLYARVTRWCSPKFWSYLQALKRVCVLLQPRHVFKT